MFLRFIESGYIFSPKCHPTFISAIDLSQGQGPRDTRQANPRGESAKGARGPGHAFGVTGLRAKNLVTTCLGKW